MKNRDNFFDSTYNIDTTTTITSASPGLELKEFLKNSVSTEDTKKYGSSKPKRVIIKAKIIND